MRVLLLACVLGGCGVVKATVDAAGPPEDVPATTVDAPTPTIDAPSSAVSVMITPAMPKTADDLLATVTGVTAPTFKWSKNGAAVSGLVTPTVGNALTTRGDLWHVDVLSGTTIVTSAETTIVNTPPPAPVVHVKSFPVVCSLDPETADADGDTVSVTLAWTKNGAPYTTAIKTTIAGDTVRIADVNQTDTFVCIATATDSIDTSTGSSGNVAPNCASGGTMSFAANGTFETGTIQTFTAASNLCHAIIDAAGAKGGVGNAVGASNTNGAEMIGTFPLVAGTQLKILVGQAAQVGTNTTQVLAGGGGTFVVDLMNDPLVIAGGGGSNFMGGILDGELEGRIVTSGGIGPGSTRADNGAGGTSLSTACGGGGGLLGDGATGGLAFIHGGNGNVGSGESHAGYGGGGNRSGSFGEGGGGGYSGGSCGNSGTWIGCGGGGSINLGQDQANTAGTNPGNGFVKITW